jgi:trehalose 6-phosphate phosphatase
VHGQKDRGEAEVDTDVAPSFVPNLKQCAILLDVDGTLVDLAPTPREVWVPPALRGVLSRLAQQTDGALALVSGRRISDLDLIFAPLTLTAVGGHGAEIRFAEGEMVANQPAAPLEAELKRELAAIAEMGPGIVVEDKEYSLALHYRLTPEKAAAVSLAAAKVVATYPSKQIEILHGKFVVEIKRKGFNKATGVKLLMTHPTFAGRRPIFLGDDTTDEPVFGIMPELDGLAFSVGRRVTAAAGCFRAPQDVRAWLQRISLQQE